MEPERDLKQIAALIGDAFSDELDIRGQAALREMRWMARLWPFVWWWAQADPSFREAFNGFVWEVPSPKGKGQIVGNVSLSRTPGNRNQWIICNVVVRKDYRGRGIARKLTQAAISEAQSLAASGIVLQVYEGNNPAYHLYTDLGFQRITAQTDWIRQGVPSVAVLDAAGYRFRPWHSADAQAVYQLASLITPTVLQWLRPLRSTQYQADGWTRLEQWISSLMAARRTYRLVALREDHLVALLVVSVALQRGKQAHTIELMVHPDHVGQLEMALISRALHMLDAAPAGQVRITTFDDQEALQRVLRSHAFEEQTTLVSMVKNL